MDTDLALSLFVLVIGAAAFLLFTAAEVYIHEAPPTRERLDVTVRGQVSQAEALATYIERRQRQLACLAWARTIALIAYVASAVLITTQHINSSIGGVVVSAVAAGLGILILQSFVRVSAENYPDAWGTFVRPGLWVSHVLFSHIVFALEAPARMAARVGTEADEESRSIREAQHLLRLVEMEEEAGVIEQDERAMIRGVIGMVDTEVLEVMVPRTDLVAVDTEMAFDDVLHVLVREGKSRVPLYEDTIDHIVGVIYAKDILRFVADGERPVDLKALAREPYFIPETKRVDDLLTELRRVKVHFAVVVDEYGGTAGIVTIEDLIEEIVGEIEDEYDIAETPIEVLADNEALVDGRVPISEIEELFHIEVPHEDVDTIGGMAFSALGRIPVAGEEIRVGDLVLTVVAVMGRRVKKVRVLFSPEPAEPESEAEARSA